MMCHCESADAASDAVGERLRTLLIGTGRSVREAAIGLSALTDGPRVMGVLLPPGIACEAIGMNGAFDVLGDFSDLSRVLAEQQVQRVLICLPLLMRAQIQSLTRTLEQAGVEWRFLPTLGDQLAGRVNPGPDEGGVVQGRMDGNGQDPRRLLDRPPRPLDESTIAATLHGRVVLITGAGGSIGSELARQVCRFEPARLVLVERSENALFEIDRELGRRFPAVERSAVLHDVTDASRTRAVVARHGPRIIFHAAAHKHVPMMEDHPAQAVENNFYGTRSIADAALAQGAERFVMISTDKAVNPTSVMGATKRLAELYIQYLNPCGRTTFRMVRFGNVLGSACSVLPIWTRQLSHGGPITVTHPDMSRYFMTIPEAAGLVMQSAALNGCDDGALNPSGRATLPGCMGGEVFVLDMGEPIRILDLARRFLRNRGLEPDVDIRIEFTGIRPGEKLREELVYEGEDMLSTDHAAIRIWRTRPPSAAHIRQITETFDRLRRPSGDLGHAWDHATPRSIVNALHAVVPEMVRSAAG